MIVFAPEYHASGLYKFWLLQSIKTSTLLAMSVEYFFASDVNSIIGKAGIFLQVKCSYLMVIGLFCLIQFGRL